METKLNVYQLIMSGGGVKGIAYVGALGVAKENGMKWANTAGVSVGAIVASIVAAGYEPEQMKYLLGSFEFGKVKDSEKLHKFPIVSELKKYAFRSNYVGRAQLRNIISKALNHNEIPCSRDERFIANIFKLAGKDSLYNGDYIEEWLYKNLFKMGIRTFADLRGGIASPDNPNGYKTRMTAVDVGRAKVVVLPYDMAYYGINPDRFEVAKAIRMSMSAPFIFEPVKIQYKKEGKSEKAYFIDGGLIDNFPTWLFNDSSGYPVVGMSLSGERKYFAFDSPLNILKSAASIIYDFGVPPDYSKLHKFVNIDTYEVSTFDFDLDEEEKEYLYNAGVSAAKTVFGT